MYAQEKQSVFQSSIGIQRGNTPEPDISSTRAHGVEAQLEILESVFRLLGERVGQLREKLHPVLDERETSPQPPSVEAVPSCQLAHRIASTRRDVATLANVIDDLTRDLAI